MLLLPYGLIAAGLLSALALFMTLKREIRVHAQRQKVRIEEMMARLDAAGQVPQLVIQQEAPMPFMLAPLHAGLNLNKRIHAMRMLRRGEDVSHIAAALAVPRKEVELLIRVQAIGKTRAAAAGSNQN
jgi:hypothetical protein